MKMANVSRKHLLTALILIAVFVVTALVAVLIFTTGPKRSAKPTSEVTPDAVTAQVIEQLRITDVTKVPKDQLAKHYTISKTVVSDFSIYISKSANSGFELACFKLTDEAYMEEMKKSIADHVAARAAGFQEMNPTEYELINSYALKENGRYVFMIISPDADEAVKIFYRMT
jgi:hypothetical protein